MPVDYSGFRRTTRVHKKDPAMGLPDGVITLSHASFQRDAPHLLENFPSKDVKERTAKWQEVKGYTGDNDCRMSRQPWAHSSTVEASPGTTSLASQSHVRDPESAIAPRWLGAGFAGSLQASGDAVSAATSMRQAQDRSSALDALREHALSGQLAHFGGRNLSRSLPGHIVHAQDHQSSRLQQSLLVEVIVGLNNSNHNQLHQLLQPRRSQLDLQHQQQLQRLRESVASELALGARHQRMVDDLLIAAGARGLNTVTGCGEVTSLAGLEPRSPNNSLGP
jgi:hypothetical protein